MKRRTIVAIDAVTPPMGNRGSSSRLRCTPPGTQAVVDDDRVYWDTNVVTTDGAHDGPIISAPRAGGPAQALTRVSPSSGPLGIIDGKIYFFYAESSTPLALERVPIGGGEVETVVPSVSRNDSLSAALGPDAIYMTNMSERGDFSILRQPFSGATAVELYKARHDVEVSEGMPRDLTLYGDFLYFLSGSGVLYRIGTEGRGLTSLAQSEFAPVFDASYIYVAYQPGGIDSPIEGVIARIAK